MSRPGEIGGPRSIWDGRRDRSALHAYEFLGILFGAAGYAPGVCRLGVFAVVVSALSLVFVQVVVQGYFPGIGPTDQRSRNM